MNLRYELTRIAIAFTTGGAVILIVLAELMITHTDSDPLALFFLLAGGWFGTLIFTSVIEPEMIDRFLKRTEE